MPAPFVIPPERRIRIVKDPTRTITMTVGKRTVWAIEGPVSPS